MALRISLASLLSFAGKDNVVNARTEVRTQRLLTCVSLLKCRRVDRLAHAVRCYAM